MNIGEASKASGVSAKMIRYYEDIQLIPSAERTLAGYRIYSKSDVHRLQFIRQARDLGFSVVEIQALLDLWNNRSRHSADVKRLAQGHIDGLQQRIKDLQQLADTLRTLVSGCAGDDRPECPILATLEQADAGRTETGKRSGELTRKKRGS